MILDSHVHIMSHGKTDNDFAAKLKEANIDGSVIISLPPASLPRFVKPGSPADRLDNLMCWAQTMPNLYPFYWIDPIEPDAIDQVAMALERGVMGFKTICNHFFCGDERAMPIYAEIAKAKKPMLFHSGILWDGLASSKYNRPSEFEALLEIDGLKFALAHVSWPWHDECLAVYGKFLSAYKLRPDLSVEMFIDLTPGTPPIYRREVLTKIFTIGYDIENNVVFGTDRRVSKYSSDWAAEWIQRDNEIYKELNLSQDTIEKIYSGNLKRFLGIS